MDRLRELEEKRDKQVTRIFWLSLEIALVFLIPALLSVYISKLLFPKFIFLAMFLTFIISWVIVIVRYQSISKKINSIEKEIKKLKETNETR